MNCLLNLKLIAIILEFYHLPVRQTIKLNVIIKPQIMLGKKLNRTYKFFFLENSNNFLEYFNNKNNFLFHSLTFVFNGATITIQHVIFHFKCISTLNLCLFNLLLIFITSKKERKFIWLHFYVSVVPAFLCVYLDCTL